MPSVEPDGPSERRAIADVDYSDPETQASFLLLEDLILDLRHETNEAFREANRRVRLYEYSLGILVIPVLLRRAAISALRRLRQGGSYVR